MKIYFIGAGPGDPELITLKGHKILQKADIVIWAGSLVNPALLEYCRSDARIYDSAGMDFRQVTEVYRENASAEGIIARVHTGDPSVYGAIQEQIDFCRKTGIALEVIPGVSSFQASAAALGQELTLPGVTQTVILSRSAGRTPVPEKETVKNLAAIGSTLILFLSISQIKTLAEELADSYSPETPCRVVYRASWPDQKIVTGTLSDIAEKVLAAGIRKQALIMVGEVFRAQEEPFFYEMSKLYDPGFTHEYRTAREKGYSKP